MTRHYEEEFEAFWCAYPKRVGNPKYEARNEWMRLAKLKALPELQAMLVATKAFAAECVKSKTEPRFIPHARTWLHNRRWEAWTPSQSDSPNSGDTTSAVAEIPSIMASVYKHIGPDRWRNRLADCEFEDGEEVLTIKTPWRFEVQKIECDFGSLIERLCGKPVKVELRA